MATDRKNFRQAGVEVGGKIFYGSAGVNAKDVDVSIKPKPRPPTIPAKFETQLYFENKEKDGFNNRTYRFSSSDPGETPGPGAYAKPEQCELINRSDSISKKGYGGFASSSSRFKNRGGKVGGAAPGSYEIADFLLESKRRTFNKANTSSFKTKFAKSVPLDEDERVMPGPGTYDVAKASSAPEVGGARSCFRSKEVRFKPRRGGVTENPAPGDYEDQTGVLVGQKAVTSSFKSGQLRFTTDIEEKHIRRTEELQNLLVKHRHTSIPPKQHAQRHFKGTFAVKPATDIMNPGPGDYEPTTEVRYTKANKKESSMFALNGLDRFGKPLVKKKAVPIMPGPGAYTQEYIEDSDRMPVSSSAFMSLTDRMGERAIRKGRPPGPAFYNPEGLNKKSFHLNSAKRWL